MEFLFFFYLLPARYLCNASFSLFLFECFLFFSSIVSARSSVAFATGARNSVKTDSWLVH